MPTEVLSYYLKNEDRKVRLGFQVILQCAPFLKGLKVSGLISMENELYFAALSSALTLPDICGKAERPTEKSFPRWRLIFISYLVPRENALSCSIVPRNWKNT